VCKILVIFQTALLQTSCTLNTGLSWSMLWGSCYIQWSLCNLSVNISLTFQIAPLLSNVLSFDFCGQRG